MTARGFPAFPAQRGRRGRSWWARAFVAAMEDASRDPDLLRRGRRIAGSGRIGPITVSPGRIAAVAEDPDGLYDVVVHLPELTEAEWDRFLDQVAAEAGHLAALLDGEVPRSLATAADAAGVELLPGVGDLESECDCPEWGNPCQHAAALCYQVSWLLDADPFVLLLVRGRAEPELLDALGPTGGEQPPGTPGVDIELLVADAALRAGALAAGAAPVRDPWVDAVRWAATHPEVTARIARSTGRADDLGASVLAWQLGGEVGLAVLADVRAGADGVLVRPDLLARRGPDARWYPFRQEGGRWSPAGPPERELDAALDGLLGAEAGE